MASKSQLLQVITFSFSFHQNSSSIIYFILSISSDHCNLRSESEQPRQHNYALALSIIRLPWVLTVSRPFCNAFASGALQGSTLHVPHSKFHVSKITFHDHNRNESTLRWRLPWTLYLPTAELPSTNQAHAHKSTVERPPPSAAADYFRGVLDLSKGKWSL